MCSHIDYNTQAVMQYICTRNVLYVWKQFNWPKRRRIFVYLFNVYALCVLQCNIYVLGFCCVFVYGYDVFHYTYLCTCFCFSYSIEGTEIWPVRLTVSLCLLCGFVYDILNTYLFFKDLVDYQNGC